MASPRANKNKMMTDAGRKRLIGAKPPVKPPGGGGRPVGKPKEKPMKRVTGGPLLKQPVVKKPNRSK